MAEELAMDDDLLVARAKRDPDSFARLYRFHYNDIFRYAMHRMFNRAAAEDVTSATFLQAVQHLDQFEGNARAFRCWLLRIATNEANSVLRTKIRRQKLLLSLAESLPQNPSNRAEDDPSEQILLLRHALLRLKPPDQSILTLCYREKLKPSEIADILGRSPATIRSQLSRALKKLRKIMNAANREPQPEVK